MSRSLSIHPIHRKYRLPWQNLALPCPLHPLPCQKQQSTHPSPFRSCWPNRPGKGKTLHRTRSPAQLLFLPTSQKTKQAPPPPTFLPSPPYPPTSKMDTPITWPDT